MIQMKQNQVKKRKKKSKKQSKEADVDGLNSNQRNELRDLLNQVFSIVKDEPEAPLQCIYCLQHFVSPIIQDNENIIEDYDTNINQHRLNQVEKKLDLVTSQNTSLQADVGNLQVDVRNLINNNKELEKTTKNLQSQVSDLQKNPSDQIKKHAFAHLLSPFIDNLKLACEIHNKQDNVLKVTLYDYKQDILNRIKDDMELDQAGLIVNKVVEEFADQITLSKLELLNLLIDKCNRNFESHGFIECFIKDVLKNVYEEHDFIYHLQKTTAIEIIFDNNDAAILMKLIHFHICRRRNKMIIESIFDENRNASQSFNYGIHGPLRITIIERHNENDIIVLGKIESGCCRVGDQCVIMPNRACVEITNIYQQNSETTFYVRGANVQLKLKNTEEEILPGFILCGAHHELCGVGREFDAKIFVLEHKSAIYPDYSAVLHIHAAVVEVQLKKLITLIDPKTGEKIQEYPGLIKRNQAAVARFELLQAGQVICMEPFQHFSPLGRFTLHDNGRIVAVGKVLEIIR
ncbi:unnamed protein product [Rotaria sordida]|uniref:GTP-eEF1A C-terminal domain-containing protein n=1 Tax=Rotaria sordida TaxID=392033 RepID=A0A814RMC2_9BILA|nr:unnamed protein product [Rotaria sordida]